MDGTSKDRLAYNLISQELKESGFERNADQCRRKIKHLKKEFKKICDNNRTSGRARKTCMFYRDLEEILGDRPAINPRPGAVIDSEVDPVEQGKDKRIF